MMSLIHARYYSHYTYLWHNFAAPTMPTLQNSRSVAVIMIAAGGATMFCIAILFCLVPLCVVWLRRNKLKLETSTNKISGKSVKLINMKVCDCHMTDHIIMQLSSFPYCILFVAASVPSNELEGFNMDENVLYIERKINDIKTTRSPVYNYPHQFSKSP